MSVNRLLVVALQGYRQPVNISHAAQGPNARLSMHRLSILCARKQENLQEVLNGPAVWNNRCRRKD